MTARQWITSKGNDTLRGGDNLIIEYDGIADLTFSRVTESGATWEGSLLIEAGTDSVRIQHHFASNDRYRVENIELSDGSTHEIDDFVFL
jgi:hypothetical protein